MDEPNSQFMFIHCAPPRLGRIKRNDIRRIAQRLIDAGGDVSASSIFKQARPRIPGTFPQYVYALDALLRRRVLKPLRGRAPQES